MKRVFNCNGSIEEDKEMGEIIQLQGDQRDNARACGGGGGGGGGGLLFFARCSAPRTPTLPARLLPALAGSWLLENEIVARADAELVVVHGF